MDTHAEWADEVRRLAHRRDAVILAHNYQLPQIQDLADGTRRSVERMMAIGSPSRTGE